MKAKRSPHDPLMRFRYRVASAGHGLTEWRDKHDAAVDDAIRLGFATRGRVKSDYVLAVPVVIERELVPNGPTPPLSTAGAARIWTPEDEAALRAMALQGANNGEIGRHLGRTPLAVRGRLTLLGLKRGRRR